MKIYPVTWLGEKSQGETLTKTGAKNRLVSFHFLQEQGMTQEHLKEYIETGTVDPKKYKRRKTT
jgi:hypothetical protein